MGQIINHHFSRTKHLLPPPIPALQDLKDGLVRLGRVVPLGDRVMPMRVERLADALLALDAVLAEQQAQLLQRHLHALMKLGGTGRGAGGQGPFEIVDGGQQLMDERFLLSGRAGVALQAAAPLEILEIGRQAQLQIGFFGELLAERV